MSKYPAKSHAQRTIDTFKTLYPDEALPVIYIAGAKTQYWSHCDQTVPLRQDRYFNYLSGAFDLPNCHVVYEPRAKKLTLYLPPVDEDDIMWSGLPLSPEQALKIYDVDDVKFSDTLEADIKQLVNVITIPDGASTLDVATSPKLLEALDETRMIKDEYELDLMRHAAKISDNSHLAVMSALPIEKNEGHIHAEFVYHCMRQGSKNQAYDPICCSGTDCGTLHYERNDQPLEDKQLVLIDAGAEWQAYASDVTRTWPIDGEWTSEAREIYETVHKMHDAAMAMIKPGVHWEDVHLKTHRVLIKRFLELGIFHNGCEEEIFETRISAAFYPHGLGHMIGMNTHDTGGKANYNDPNPMLRYLRIRRKLQENMVVTVEPGCYFNKFLLDHHVSASMRSKYINQEVLDKYWPVGGVRIEDDVVITAKGPEDLTKITKDADEIAKIVKDGLSKGRRGFHCVV